MGGPRGRAVSMGCVLGGRRRRASRREERGGEREEGGRKKNLALRGLRVEIIWEKVRDPFGEGVTKKRRAFDI